MRVNKEDKAESKREINKESPEKIKKGKGTKKKESD
jgi:hypothetical protein